jgi:hypothetical protein
MSFPKLMARSILLALLISGAAANAETKQAPVKLALAAPPAPAPRSPALVESPRATDQDAPVASPAGHTNWWPWALIAVAAAGVGALVFLSSGRDPACPGGRTCK